MTPRERELRELYSMAVLFEKVRVECHACNMRYDQIDTTPPYVCGACGSQCIEVWALVRDVTHPEETADEPHQG